MMPLVRRASLVALALIVLLGVTALSATSCTDDMPQERSEASGAEIVQVATADDVTLDGRLWDRGDQRLAIYLHEFREDQSSWWPYAKRDRSRPISAMTIDFRGHGTSPGDLEDVEGMVEDVEATIRFARERGFRQIMLVGAGMGAAVALVAAVEVPDVTVVGFSTPADFDQLDVVSVAELIADRMQLFATRDDVSAADSLHRFRALSNVDTRQARLYPGRSHGVALLEGRAGADIRARFEELLDEFWVPAED